MPQMQSTQSTNSGAPDFIVVTSNEDELHCGFHEFAEKVNRKLRAGYQLHGQPFSIHQILCQAMVRMEGCPSQADTTVFYKQPNSLHMV